LISIYGVDVRGVSTPNVFVGVLVFLTGISQVLAGIMEFITGNTVSGGSCSSVTSSSSILIALQFGATVFTSFGAFSLSYAMIYLPGSGILAAYTDATTGKLNAEFPQALAMYIWAWFILAMIFTVGAMRSSWVLLCDLVCVDLLFLVQAIGLMTGNKKCDLAASALGFLVAFLTCETRSFVSLNVSGANTSQIGLALQVYGQVVWYHLVFQLFRYPTTPNVGLCWLHVTRSCTTVQSPYDL
jgi:uncharacterized protein